MVKEDKHKRVPSFLRSLFRMLEDDSNREHVVWNPSGTAFEIKHVQNFAEKVLPEYFKHKNFSSFIRQLNMYNFRKVRPDDDENVAFENRLFRKHRKDLLSEIERKEGARRPVREVKAEEKSQLEMLEQIQEIARRQQNYEGRLKKVLEGLEESQASLRLLEEGIVARQREVGDRLESLGRVVLQSTYAPRLELE